MPYFRLLTKNISNSGRTEFVEKHKKYNKIYFQCTIKDKKLLTILVRSVRCFTLNIPAYKYVLAVIESKLKKN